MREGNLISLVKPLKLSVVSDEGSIPLLQLKASKSSSAFKSFLLLLLLVGLHLES